MRGVRACVLVCVVYELRPELEGAVLRSSSPCDTWREVLGAAWRRRPVLLLLGSS